MEVKNFFDTQTFTLSYIVYDKRTRDAVIIDPVLDFDPISWSIHYHSLDKLSCFINDHQLKVHFLLDTHIHADHITALDAAKKRFSGQTVMNGAIAIVQQTFKSIYNFPESWRTDGSQFDVLVNDGDILDAGSIRVLVLHTPGHTPACTTYKINDMVFTGDALFMPDVGSGRCDFPNGSAQNLYNSIQNKIFTLVDETRVFPGHDYQPNGRALRTMCTIGESKSNNIDIQKSLPEEDYVLFINKRDSKLPFPKLLFQAVQININAGRMPSPESNGSCYLKVPLKVE